MKTVFVLIIMTMSGPVETPRPFYSIEDCVQMQKSIEFDSYCVERKVESMKKRSLAFMNPLESRPKDVD